MIQLWDYHTHHKRCNHATGDLSDYINSAIKKGLVEIGLSDHWPMHTMPNKDLVESWAMSLDNIPIYIQEAKNLRTYYSNKIKIQIGTEIDYCSAVFDSYLNQIYPFLDNFDYLIGSVHVIKAPNGDYVPIDSSNNPELMKKIGIYQFYEIYFQELLKMINSRFFNIIGHFDLPKKYGIQPTLELWPFILEILDEIKKNDACVEINTSGFRKKVGIQYPSEKIIKELIIREIPLTLGSDAHLPDEVGYKFKEIVHNLKNWSKELNVPFYLAKFSQKDRELIKFES